MSKLISLMVTAAFLSLGVLLGVLNPTLVPVDLFLYQISLPLSVLLAIVMTLGMLVGSFFILGQVMKLRLKIQTLTKQNKQLSNDLITFKKNHLQAIKTGEGDISLLASDDKTALTHKEGV